jgi:type IV pilus assembly protein PilC
MAGVLVYKPIYLLPFIFVYKAVAMILSLPFKLVHYFSLGFFVFFYTIIDFIVTMILDIFKFFLTIFMYASNGSYLVVKFILNIIIKKIIKYPVLGFVVISYTVYKTFKYSLLGFVALFNLVLNIYDVISYNSRVRAQRRKEEAERLYQERVREVERKRADRLKREETLKSKKAELIAERKKQRELNTYQNTDVVIEKKTFGDKINDVLQLMLSYPASLNKKIIDAYNNSSIVKNMRNRRDLEREALLISFEAEDDQRSNVKQLYQYTAKNPDGKVITGYFDAYSRVEVHSFLLSEGFEVYSIKTNDTIRFLYGASGAFKTKIKTKDLIFFLTQLSTYIKAGITLVDALKILANQFKNKGYQRVFRSLIYDLTMGDSFSEALNKQGNAFPKILINMVRAAEMTGQLPEVLDDMGDYFTQIDKTRKQMVTVMMYPAIILVIAVAVITFILMYVIPKFVQIYESMDSSQIPAFTKFIIGSSEFLKNYSLFVLLGVGVLIGLFSYMYSNVKLFRTFIQWITMHMPGFGQTIIYNEVTMFSKTFSSLLSHNVFITESMEILNRITNNEIYKMLILDTLTNLARGDKISDAFRNHWAFPIPAYEMIVTGEKTGELPEMMSKVANYYQEQHANSVSRLKTFIEPALIIFLTAIVGGIVLAIVIPMFNMYSTIQGG